MPKRFELYPEGQLRNAIRGWLDGNEWPQLIFEYWSRENQRSGPYASQIGKLLKGELEPYPSFFMRLAEINHDVEYCNIEAIRDPKTAKRIKEGKPLYVNGHFCGAEDFFMLYVGLLESPYQKSRIDITQ